MKGVTRSRFIGYSAAIAALPAMPAAQAQSLTAVRAGAIGDDQATPFLYAASGGIFKRYGIDGQLTRTSSGSATAAAVAGGSFDVGQSSIMSICTAHLRGLDLILLAPGGVYDSNHPTNAIVVRADSPIKVAADLNNRTISVSSLNDFFTLSIRTWVDAHGGDSASLKMTEVPMGGALAAVATGRIDAAILVFPFLRPALEAGKVRKLGDPGSAVAPRYLQSAWFTTREYADKNPNLMLQFMLAMRESAAYVNAHNAETVPLVAAYTGLAPEVVASGRVQHGVRLEIATIQPLIDDGARYKIIPARFDAHDVIYPPALRT
jgi:NitT/TauT family transport system substrate-binding protein